jgi:hypothetical protein
MQLTLRLVKPRLVALALREPPVGRAHRDVQDKVEL